MADGERRTDAFQRIGDLESLLTRLNDALACCAETAGGMGRQPRHPVILLMGVPRSGTTLFLQWLAANAGVGYPSNLIARFYGAPFIGALVQRMLSEPALAFRDELYDVVPAGEVGFDSSLGKTRGALAPNEFRYFWRRFFRFEGDESLSFHNLTGSDPDGFAAELALLEGVWDRPLAMKGLVMNWHIPLLDTILEKALFVHVKREPADVALSLLRAREQFFGERGTWYSFRPPEYQGLRTLSPLAQVVGQVHSIQSAVEKGLSAVAEQRRLTVDYEAFCAAPGRVYHELRERLEGQGHVLPGDYSGPAAFTRPAAAGGAEREAIAAAFRRLAGAGGADIVELLRNENL